MKILGTATVVRQARLITRDMGYAVTLCSGLQYETNLCVMVYDRAGGRTHPKNPDYQFSFWLTQVTDVTCHEDASPHCTDSILPLGD